MATQSSILAWRIPWAEEPGGLQSMRSQSRTRLSDLACTRLFKSPISKYSHVAGRVPTYVFLGDNSAPWLPRWHSGKEFACQCRRHKRSRFDPWVGEIPWRRAWQPSPAFLPGESHGQRSLAGYSPYGRKELDLTKVTYHVHCFQEPSCSMLESSWSYVQFSSVQFSRSVMPDSLRPHESQHARLPCPSLTPQVYSDSCPLSQ